MKLFKTLLLIFLCANISYAQKSKVLNIGAIADFPISKKLYYNYGVGAEASLLINTPNTKNFIFTFSALQYQFYAYDYDLSTIPATQIKKTKNDFFLRTTIGKLIQIKDKFFFNVQGGFGIGNAGRVQSSQIQPIFLAGPTFILPIKEKYCVKLHGSVGTFASGFFINVGAAFGFKFH
jgi:hypothetical protein